MRSVFDHPEPDTGRPRRQPAVLTGPWRGSPGRRRVPVPIAAGVVALVTLIVLTLLVMATAYGGSRGRGGSGNGGSGNGGSWPAAFPVARIDHILVRGMQPRSAWTLPADGSDHLPVAAAIRL
ncbi:hypothetical protein [Actinacidiphila sp. bgisy167]|uniref:hypothetical protein n=1 Tax=Actinacidiphila sp. bgisy167 TaxID=3413797 RepID=UPI003D750091